MVAGTHSQWPLDRSHRWQALALMLGMAVMIGLLGGLVWAGRYTSTEAQDAIIDSVRVRVVADQVAYLIRDAEAMAYDQLRGQRPAREPKAQLRQALTLLGELQDMVGTDPALQAWMEALQITVRARQRSVETSLQLAAEGKAHAGLQHLTQAQVVFPMDPDLRGLTRTIEQWVANVRTDARVTRQRRQILLLCAAMQLVLLISIVVLAWRQASRRSQAEWRLQQAERHSRQILQTVREPIILLDGQLRVLQINAAFCDIYGIDAGRATGQPLAVLGNGVWEDAALLERLSQVLDRDRELWDHELNQQLPDGALRCVIVNARRMLHSDQQAPTLLLTVSDITSRALAERQVRELNRQLESKVALVSDINRELEAFTYSISHDLRAPLRHVSRFAERLGSHLDGRGDDLSRHYIEVILSASRRMAELIEDLLVFSRLGRGTLRSQPVEMQRLVEDVRELLQSDEPARKVLWQIADLPVVQGDESMLRTVWQNLLGNAVKYSAPKEQPCIEVTVHDNGRGEHVFCVRDNGTGFDMRYVNKLFGVFQRLHRASEFSGNGIGLASVQRIVARHGGQVWAEGEPGVGAAFFFSLPIAEARAMQREQ
ncbi:PAS domain S-box [Frateuria aurantia DSM 6220]|uniref:histidine kinase n=2 Tax=Frateuria aurantia TaxID=81475 RepID=H8L1X8_FRAAD|nr:PAS domain S-box [Frateuria aurantia DSM 6220]